MMRASVFLLGLLILPLAAGADGNGLIKKPSPYDVTETLDRLETVLEEKGITIALRWNHGQRASEADIELRDTQVLMFGNPKIGSHLMTSVQSAGIDLPMKALAWRDVDDQVWLAYNDPAYVAERHGIDDRADVLEKLSMALDNLTDAAVSRE